MAPPAAKKPRSGVTVYSGVTVDSNRLKIQIKTPYNMPNTFTQMYAQIVFCPKHRKNLIHADFEERLFKYITGMIQERGQKLIAINGMPDHLHIFIGFKPTLCISDLVREIKISSARFLRANQWVPTDFSWQDGFGCFTYAHSQIDSVAKYVMNQKQHHQKQSFKDEYVLTLEKFAIPFDEKYLFEFYDEI